MRPPPVIKGWQTEPDMLAWVRTAPDKESYQRRLAVSLVARRGCYVPEVADMLGVSTASVWRWLQQYNAAGPDAVRARPRGGRRDTHLSLDTEAAVLQQLHARALHGEVLTASDVRPAVERAIGQPVSRSYLYDLLRRHDWRKLAPRPRHPEADLAVQEAYKKTSRAASKPR